MNWLGDYPIQCQVVKMHCLIDYCLKHLFSTKCNNLASIGFDMKTECHLCV